MKIYEKRERERGSIIYIQILTRKGETKKRRKKKKKVFNYVGRGHG